MYQTEITYNDGRTEHCVFSSPEIRRDYINAHLGNIDDCWCSTPSGVWFSIYDCPWY